MKEIDKWLEQFRKIWEGRFKLQLDKVLLTIKNNKEMNTSFAPFDGLSLTNQPAPYL